MGEEAELGEKVKENKGEGLYAAEMEDIGLSFFFINQTDLCDSEFQLCFLLSVPCSSKCLFPNTSLFFQDTRTISPAMDGGKIALKYIQKSY